MKWILCDERLPKEGQMVLTTIRGHDVIIPQEGETIDEAIERIWNDVCYVSIGFIGSDGWYGADGFPEVVHPIAWMPLPKPYKADRKTENSSEKPNNCDTCKHNKLEWYSEVCDGCSKAHSNYEPKDEPQMGDAKPIPLSNRVTHIEDEPQIFICPIQNDYEALIEDKPQTERSE